MDEVKKYTPNSIANEIMAEDAWHDSLWVRDEDYEALRAERDALKLRLAAAEDMNAACNADFSRIRAELAALRAELQKVRSAAISGMDAAAQHGHSLVQQAARLKAESNPDALESERAANALLTEQLQKAEADLAALRAERDALRAEVELCKERAYAMLAELVRMIGPEKVRRLIDAHEEIDRQS